MGVLAAVTSESILNQATALLQWAISGFTSLMSWALGNPYMIILLVMFIVGFAVSLLARVIYSL